MQDWRSFFDNQSESLPENQRLSEAAFAIEIAVQFILNKTMDCGHIQMFSPSQSLIPHMCAEVIKRGYFHHEYNHFLETLHEVRNPDSFPIYQVAQQHGFSIPENDFLPFLQRSHYYLAGKIFLGENTIFEHIVDNFCNMLRLELVNHGIPVHHFQMLWDSKTQCIYFATVWPKNISYEN